MHVRALNLWMRSIRTKFLLRWWDKVHDAHRITNALSKKKSLHMTGRLLSGSILARMLSLPMIGYVAHLITTWTAYRELSGPVFGSRFC